VVVLLLHTLCNWPGLQSLLKFRLNVCLLRTAKLASGFINICCSLSAVGCRLSLTAKYSVAKLTDVTAIHKKLLHLSSLLSFALLLIQLLADFVLLLLLLLFLYTLYTLLPAYFGIGIGIFAHISNSRNKAVVVAMVVLVVGFIHANIFRL